MNFALRIVVLILFFGILPDTSFCQETDSLSINSPQKGIKYNRVRPTFLHFSVRTLPAINDFPQEKQQPNTDYNINKSYNIKLNLPLVYSDRLNIIGQVRYKNEQLHFGYDMANEEKEIHFDNVGVSFLFKYKFKNEYYIGGHAGGFFKADELAFERYASILDFNSSIVIGKDLPLGTIGFGGLVGNSQSRLTMYPLFLFEYQLSNSWKVEMKLPKEIQFRKIIKPDNFYLIGGAEVNAANYFISEGIFDNNQNLEYRRAAVDFRIGLEKEIYDFLWFGLDVGATQPIYSALVQSGEPTRNKVFDFGHSFTPYASFSVFLVPPKSMMRKFKK